MSTVCNLICIKLECLKDYNINFILAGCAAIIALLRVVNSRKVGIKSCKQRCMIAGFFPSTGIPVDPRGMRGGCNIGCSPDMIETPSFVSCIPIPRPVRPPSVKFAVGYVLPRYVDPIPGVLRFR